MRSAVARKNFIVESGGNLWQWQWYDNGVVALIVASISGNWYDHFQKMILDLWMSSMCFLSYQTVSEARVSLHPESKFFSETY